MRVLFSVYNISGYLLAELRELVESGAKVSVIETPCGIKKGELGTKIVWIDRTNLQEAANMVESESFDVYFCGGWADKWLLDLAKVLHRRGTKTVLLCDTPWRGRLKQWIHCFFSRAYLVPRFDYAWCAGAPQAKYMRRLGFVDDQIKTGYYCADTAKFSAIGRARIQHGRSDRVEGVRVFLYIGRYVPVKNMRRMERAFLFALERAGGSDCRLRCVGDGVLWNERTIHPAIEHLGYRDPGELQEYVKDADVFVLPSLYEPWGVVVHEAALMALPMLCSNRVQAATEFLTTNGYTFDPEDESDMVSAFAKMMNATDAELAVMGKKSYCLGMSYTTKDWANAVMEMGR